MADTVYKFVDINGNEIEEELHCISTKHGLMCPEDKTKLTGIEEGANKYIHPSTHPATMITEDETHRFVTDEEKVTWNNNNITIDDALDADSTNPVQNKIITAELSEKIKADYVSIDSKTWTQSNITSGSFLCIYNANGIWVTGSGSSKGLYYSTDGMTWTQSNITSGSFLCIYNANGIWVAVSDSDNGLYYSTDGKSWAQSNITSGYFNCVYNANGIWVAGRDSDKGLYYSTDGMTWTQSNITSGTFKCVYNANGIWVTGSFNNGLYYSTDGMTWTQSNITSGYFGYVYYANGIWVADGDVDGLYYSTDGKSWAQSNITSGTFNCVYNANGIWVAGSFNSGLYYSTDGMTWTQSNITSGTFKCVYNANGIWVAGSNSDYGLYYSTDGKSWTQSNITSGTFYCVYNANGIWVTGGSNNGLYYSESSINKTVEELQASYDNGDLLFCKIDSNIIPLTAMNADSDPRFVFSGTINSKSYYVAVNSDNTVIYTCTELGSTDLSNIDNDTFKAKVEASGFSSGAAIQFITWEVND